MTSNRNIYLTLGLLSLAAYGWIGFHWLHDHTTDFTVCLFKNVTGIACPSCGITRSILLLLYGNIPGSVMTNPLGLVAFPLLIIVPAWILKDLLRRSESMAKIYRVAEVKLKSKKLIYLPLITLMVINWIWNITKGL